MSTAFSALRRAEAEESEFKASLVYRANSGQPGIHKETPSSVSGRGFGWGNNFQETQEGRKSKRSAWAKE